MSDAPPRASLTRLRGLYLIADDDPRWKHDPVEQAGAALAAGAGAVQLRAKHATDRRALAWARTLRELTAAHGALLLLNDRFDLALASNADGVHLGQQDVPPARLPPGARARLLVGRSTHTLQQLRDALEEPVDYLAFGPVFCTASKRPLYPPRGLALLAQAARLAAPRPLVAIGGIDAARAGDVLRAGASAVAVISAVAGSGDPAAAARGLARALAAADLP